MTPRHDICDGDTTTARGRVIAPSCNDLLDGRAIAYEGDAVYCQTCETTGKIVCIGDRIPDLGPNGRQTALSGDWCVCRCDPHPRLIASQSRSGTRT
ncbi:PAAR domain-containing protein [Pandoraea norimbergensis]